MLDERPLVGSILFGSRPHLGFGLLMCARPRQTYRMVFETINCEGRRFDLGWIAEPLTAQPSRGRRPDLVGSEAAS